jgi:hypothetical protein
VCWILEPRRRESSFLWATRRRAGATQGPLLHRLRGVFLTAIGADSSQIEASFCAAVRIAKEQKSTEAPFHVRHVPGATVPLRRQAGSSASGHQRSSPPSDDRRVRANSGSRHLPSPERQIHDLLPVFDSGHGSPRLKGNSGMRQAGTIEIAFQRMGVLQSPILQQVQEETLGEVRSVGWPMPAPTSKSV